MQNGLTVVADQNRFTVNPLWTRAGRTVDPTELPVVGQFVIRSTEVVIPAKAGIQSRPSPEH